MIKVLFVCTGNICRSPTGEGVFRDRVTALGFDAKIEVDSCGMMGWHIGKGPDARSQAAARTRGFNLSELQARQISTNDFHDFDLLLAMDKSHFDEMQEMAPVGTAHKVRLFMEPISALFGTMEVPDPYYGGVEGFELVLDMIEAGSNQWIAELMDK